MFEVKENLGEITMRDPQSGVTVRFMKGESHSFVCIDMGTTSGKDYVEISRRMTDFAYSEGLLEKGSPRSIFRKEARHQFGSSLKKAREENGLSIREVAARTGINKSVISRTEGGRANTTIDTINELVDFYGYRLELKKNAR